MGLRMVSSTIEEKTVMKIAALDVGSFVDGLQWISSVIQARKEIPVWIQFRQAYEKSPTLEVAVQWKEIQRDDTDQEQHRD
jgi:hypothetical protein